TDQKLAQLIERHDLYHLRHQLGMEYAIQELRGQIDIQIWKNSFMYYDEDAEYAKKSARIGITVTDTDGDRAYAIARDLAAIAIVEEHRPERPEGRGFLIAMIAVVVGIGSLLGAALVVGAFDPRVHDTDDVARLGLPVLGHVPGFAGDHIGALRSRGASGARV